MTRPSNDLLVAAVFIVGIAVVATLIWLLALMFAPSPATSTPVPRHDVSRSEGRPSMSAREYVALESLAYDWDQDQWRCLVLLIDRESHWDARAKNSDSGASGIFQMMESPSGIEFRTYAIKDQARLGTKYIADRYETPCKALAHERRWSWY